MLEFIKLVHDKMDNIVQVLLVFIEAKTLPLSPILTAQFSTID